MLVPCLRCGQGAGWLHVQATLCCRSPKFLTTGTRKLDAPPSPRPIRLGVGEWGSCLSKDWYLKSSRRIYKHQTQTRWSLQMARRPPRGKGAQEGRSQNRSRRNGPWRYGGEGAGSSLAAFFSGIPAGPTRDRKYFPRSRRDAGCSPSVRWEWVPGGRGGGGRGASGEGRWRPGKPGSWGTRARGSYEHAGAGGGAGLRIGRLVPRPGPGGSRRDRGMEMGCCGPTLQGPGGRRRARDGPYPEPALNSCLFSLQPLASGIFRSDWSDFSCHDLLVLAS